MKKLETLSHVFYELESGAVDRGKAIQELTLAGISQEAAAKFIDDAAAMPEYALPFIRGLASGIVKGVLA
jgi:hypothetical protein